MSQSPQPMSEAEYLAWSERQEMTYEFDGVRPVAMSGGTITHDMIAENLRFAFMTRLRGTGCRALGPHVRVPTGQGRYRYPDMLVTCSPFEGSDRDVAAPVVIFEIMSESTGAKDRGQKMQEYRALPPVVQYVMVEQATTMATVVTRAGDRGDGLWRIDVFRDGDVIPLPEIVVELPLAELFVDVMLPPEDHGG